MREEDGEYFELRPPKEEPLPLAGLAKKVIAVKEAAEQVRQTPFQTERLHQSPFFLLKAKLSSDHIAASELPPTIAPLDKFLELTRLGDVSRADIAALWQERMLNEVGVRISYARDGWHWVDLAKEL